MKKVAYVLGGLVLLYLILALIGPSTIKVERSISINKSVNTIATALTDFKFFHEKWSPWTEKDPAMTTNYSGNAGEIGHRLEWSGNKEVGKGSMELASVRGDSICQKLSFEGEGDSKSYYITKPTGDSTQVTWGIAFDVGFMGRPFMLFMNMDKMMGADFEKGLGNLKRAIEEIKEEPKFEIVEQNWEERTYIGKRATVSTENNMEKLTAFFMENFPLLFMGLEKNKIQPMSPPSAIYFKWEEKQADLAAVASVAKGTNVKGWETFTLPAGKVLMIAYMGPDEGSMAAHNAMGEYIKKNSLEQMNVVEEYVTDRETEKDPAKWLTNIYYLVK